MKLAFILFRYFPYGGLQRDFLRIAKTCLQRGHEVSVFTMAWEGVPCDGLPVTIVPVKGIQNHSRIQSFIKALPPLLAQHPFDRIIGFNKMPGLDVYYAADTCFQAKARRQHGAWFRLMPRYRALLACEQAVFAREARTEILLLADKQQHEFTEFYDTPAQRFHLLPPGIARDRMVTGQVSKAGRLVLFIGSGFRTKGLDRAILALAGLPEVLRLETRLVIIGSDRVNGFLKEARRQGVQGQIDFMGGREDVPAFLQQADLLIHPARNENTGTVLLEALVAGVPVLTTDVCGYAHHVLAARAGTVLASPFRQEALNEALKDMLSSPDSATLRANALDYARRADIYRLPEYATDLIESLTP